MPTRFQCIGIIAKSGDPGIAGTLNQLYQYLLERGYRVVIDEASAGLIHAHSVLALPIGSVSQHADLIIAVGGDGTFLTAARAAANDEIPILGVNLGRLGFLVDISPKHLQDRLEPILAGHYKTERRHLLRATIIREQAIIHQQTAINEVVVHRWVTPSMIEIITHIDGTYLNTQRSDGLIVATPTGSTAYSLSAGGPILHPALNALVLVPLNPHTLSNRPIVINDDSEIEISFNNAKQFNAQVTCDHLDIPDVRSSDTIRIQKAERPITILHPEDHDFFNILRSKLNWSGGYPGN
ncbi:MAG: NAD(+) kinase [Methylococcaceae bacterium]|jgi:NAD+ kinase|nr:NAD(+) kinase [Methylococcaceae bacterium]